VSCETLCPYKLLLLLPWFLLLLFVALIQVFRVVSTLTVLVELVKMLQPAVLLFSAAAARSSAGIPAVCQVMNPGLSSVVLSSLVECAADSSNCMFASW